MPRPIDIIYDVVIEKMDGIYPVRIYIKFDERRIPHILAAKNAITNKNTRTPLPNNPRLKEALTMLKWSANHDPDQPHPGILAFLRSI